MTEAAGRSGPKYRRIADDLLRRIGAGEFNGKLPSKDQLKDQYGAAVNTVERAIDELRKAGRVETVQGSGTFILPEPGPSQYEQVMARLDDLDERVRLLESQKAAEGEPER